MNDVDVIVVGAGVAGLSAAAELRRMNRSCVVLEASGRIGGRAWTDLPTALKGAAFDHGASWLHAAERNPLVPIAAASGETLHNSDTVRRHRVFVDGRPADPVELEEFEQSRERFETLLTRRARELPDIAFADALAPLRGDPWTATLETWEATLIAAADPREFSLRDWLDNELEGSNLVVEGGLGAFVERRLGPAAGEVRLNTPVTRLRWGGGVAAETRHGTLRARAAVVTVSTGVLAAGGIRFEPGLPAATEAAIEALPMGLLSKVALHASGVDRLDLPDTCSLRARVAPGAAAMFFNAWPFGAHHVIGFVGGPAAWELSRAGARASVEFAREQLRAMLGTRADAALGAAVATQWGADPHYLGAYAYARPGHADARAALSAPLDGGRLVLAGEAGCTDGLAGTVGGAWLSGRRAARIAVDYLTLQPG